MTCWSRFPTKQAALLNLRPAPELCTHPSTNIQAQVNRPAVSRSQMMFFQSIRLGEGARSRWQRSDLPAREQRLSGSSVAAYVLPTDFRPWEHEKSFITSSIYWSPSPALLSVVKGWDVRGCRAKRGGIFSPSPQLIPKAFFPAL